MGFLDKLRRTATKAVDEHGDKVADGIDRAARAADARTKGKYRDKIETGSGKAKEALERLDRKDDGDVARDAPSATHPVPPGPTPGGPFPGEPSPPDPSPPTPTPDPMPPAPGPDPVPPAPGPDPTPPGPSPSPPATSGSEADDSRA